jgi:prepilin-type N-terminal cleavage/methylation domain-containing protein
MNRLTSPNGFTMIEVLAALAIVSVSLVLLFDLKQTVHVRQQRQLLQVAIVTQEANALAVLRRIDPWREGAGKVRLDADTTLRWRAMKIGQPRAALDWLGRTSSVRVALFRVRYELVGKDRPMASGEVELLGRNRDLH